MKLLLRWLCVAGLCLVTSLVQMAGTVSGDLPRSRAEAQGVRSARLVEFLEALDAIPSMHSVMLVRHGKVVMEGWWAPYEATANHELYSLSKSFASTAMGMAIAEKRLTLDDEVLKFFPEDAPENPSAQLKGMRVRDLLTMSTGHQDEPSAAADRITPRTFLAQAVPHKPGTHFKYNTAATFMLSAIVQKQTGQTVLDYLRPRLFEPLGIRHPEWATNAQGVSLGGYGLKVTTEDIAKFGQLYLQRGQWRGQTLLPAAWVDLATSRQVSNGSNPTSDWDQGYGFQFWRCRHGAYRGDGAFGQYCVVFPEQDAVLVITSGVKDMQAVLNQVWDKLLPAFQPRSLRRDRVAEDQLRLRLGGLALKPVSGDAAAGTAVTALAGRRIEFETNAEGWESAQLAAATASEWRLKLRIRGVESVIPLGRGAWRAGRTDYGPYRNEPVAGSGAWTAADTFTARWVLTETPFNVTLRLRVAGDGVTRELEQNVSFGGTAPQALTGRLR
jgi:CubicO group peptidase (beta-lactamase class C family)